MSTNRYNNEFWDQCLQGLVDVTTAGNIGFVLVESGYTFNAADIALDDIPASARVTTFENLSNVAVSGGGVMSADPVTFADLTGDPSVAGVSFFDSGVEGTSYLMGYHTDVDWTPDGSDLIVSFPNDVISLKHTSPAADELFYDEFLNALLTGGVDVDDGLWKFDLICASGGSYTFSAAHSYSDLNTSGELLGTFSTLGSITYVDGVLDCADPSWTAVTSGASADLTHMVLLHDDSGVDLIACLIPLPSTIDPDNQDIDITLGSRLLRV